MFLIPTLLCPKPWENMSGNETQRFCTHCKKHVHNLEALSVPDRLALLSSPAASNCARYRVAIRRPAKGREADYHRHLLKHGVGVALVGSVFLVLWEIQAQAEKERIYRAVPPHRPPLSMTDRNMPEKLYSQHEIVTLGVIAVPEPPPKASDMCRPNDKIPPYVDVHLDPVAIDKLIEEAEQSRSREPEPGAKKH